MKNNILFSQRQNACTASGLKLLSPRINFPSHYLLRRDKPALQSLMLRQALSFLPELKPSLSSICLVLAGETSSPTLRRRGKRCPLLYVGDMKYLQAEDRVIIVFKIGLERTFTSSSCAVVLKELLNTIYKQKLIYYTEKIYFRDDGNI